MLEDIIENISSMDMTSMGPYFESGILLGTAKHTFYPSWFRTLYHAEEPGGSQVYLEVNGLRDFLKVSRSPITWQDARTILHELSQLEGGLPLVDTVGHCLYLIADPMLVARAFLSIRQKLPTWFYEEYLFSPRRLSEWKCIDLYETLKDSEIAFPEILLLLEDIKESGVEYWFNLNSLAGNFGTADSILKLLTFSPGEVPSWFRELHYPGYPGYPGEPTGSYLDRFLEENGIKMTPCNAIRALNESFKTTGAIRNLADVKAYLLEVPSEPVEVHSIHIVESPRRSSDSKRCTYKHCTGTRLEGLHHCLKCIIKRHNGASDRLCCYKYQYSSPKHPIGSGCTRTALHKKDYCSKCFSKKIL